MKQRIKTGVDIAMTVLFLGQMGYHMMDNRMHEWTGVILCALFLLHHALNPGWRRGLFRGRYSASRVWLTLVDVLLTLAMVAVIVSAVLVSRHVFDFLGLRMRAVGRRIHMPATMWAFMLTGPATKITNLGALKTVLGIRRFLLYIGFVVVFSLITGMAVNAFGMMP